MSSWNEFTCPVHHVTADAWSMDVLAREVATLYAAAVSGREPRLPALPVQYGGAVGTLAAGIPEGPAVGKGLVAALYAKLDGELISEFEALSYYVIVATAGHDTTSSSTAGAIWALAENPDEFAKVKADPSVEKFTR